MASDLPTALPAQPGLPRGILRGVQGELQVPNAATSSQSDLPMASGPTITLGGGFSPINGMEFLGQSEAKGNALTKCQRLFNVREIRKPGENFVITGRILKSTKVKEAWNMTFEIDPVTRKVIKASCNCYVGSTGKCKHSRAVLSPPPLALCIAHSRCISNNLNTNLFGIDLVDVNIGILGIHSNFFALHFSNLI